MISFVILTSFLRPLLNLSNFNYVWNIQIEAFQIITLSTEGGILTYDKISKKPLFSFIWEKPIPYALRLPTGEIYFVSDKKLYKIFPLSPFPIFLNWVGEIKSLGYHQNLIFVEEKEGRIRAYSKEGGELGVTSPPKDAQWVGEKGAIPKNSPRLGFLTPFYVFDPVLGKVYFTSIYEKNSFVFVGTWGKGVYIYDKNTWGLQDSINLGIEPKEVYIIENLDGFTFCIAGKHGITLLKMTNQRYETNTILPSTKKITFYALKNTKGGMVLLGDDGLYIFRGIELTKKPLKFSPEGEPLYFEILDDSTIYLVTTKNIYKIKDKTVIPLVTLKDDFINYSLGYGDRLLLFTNLGLLTFKLNKDSLFYLERAELKKPVFAGKIFNDTLYLLTEDELLYAKLGENSFQKLKIPFKPTQGTKYPIEIDHDIIYLGTPYGLYLYDKWKRNWEYFDKSRGLLEDSITSIRSFGNFLFLGTRLGLIILQNERKN